MHDASKRGVSTGRSEEQEPAHWTPSRGPGILARPRPSGPDILSTLTAVD